MLTRYRRQNVEGARLLVGERWDARSRCWLPCYPDLIAHPRPRRPRRQRLPRLPRLQRLPPLSPAAPRLARHLRPPLPERPASTRCAPALPAARQRKGEWAPAADLLMTTNDDTR